MANSQLTFTTEAAAILAEKKIWIETIRNAVSRGDIVGDGVNHYDNLVSVNTLTDEEIAALRIYSFTLGIIDYSLPGTSSYALVKKATGLEKWFFPKPDDTLLAGVADYAIEDYNSDWEALP